MKYLSIIKKFVSPALILIIILSFAAYFIISSHDNKKPLPGYIEANLTYISTDASGKLTNLAVTRGEKVSKSQLLFTLNKTPYKFKFNSANLTYDADFYNYENLLTGKRNPYILQVEAEVNKARANLDYAQHTFDRYKLLLKSHSISRENYEQKLSQYLQAKSALKSLQAQLKTYKLGGREKLILSAKAKMKASAQNAALAKWQLQQTQVTSPEAATVYDTYYWPGEEVAADHPVISLLVPNQIKLVFFVSETQLSHIRLNQTIYFHIDGINKKFKAKINYISTTAEYTPPVIYSESVRNDLIYRVEAHILPTKTPQWHPGQPVSVYLNGAH